MKRNQVILVCDFCADPFSVKQSRVKSSRFCSVKCRASSAKVSMAGKPMPDGCVRAKPGPHCRLTPAKKCGHLAAKGRVYCPACRVVEYSKISSVPCDTCGKEMLLCPSETRKIKCCSMKCRNRQVSLRQSGDKSHLWRGGLSDANRTLRNSYKYSDWRAAVFSRDAYSCQMCGKTGKNLVADHIKEWSLYPALRFDVENGRTLCRPCHQTTDNFGGRMHAKLKALEVNGTLQYRLL